MSAKGEELKRMYPSFDPEKHTTGPNCMLALPGGEIISFKELVECWEKNKAPTPVEAVHVDAVDTSAKRVDETAERKHVEAVPQDWDAWIEKHAHSFAITSNMYVEVFDLRARLASLPAAVPVEELRELVADADEPDTDWSVSTVLRELRLLIDKHAGKP